MMKRKLFLRQKYIIQILPINRDIKYLPNVPTRKASKEKPNVSKPWYWGSLVKKKILLLAQSICLSLNKKEFPLVS